MKLFLRVSIVPPAELTLFVLEKNKKIETPKGSSISQNPLFISQGTQEIPIEKKASGKTSCKELKIPVIIDPPVISRKVKIEFVADFKVAQKIERAREILRHKFPQAKLEDIIDQALEDMLEKRDPERKAKRQENQKKTGPHKSLDTLPQSQPPSNVSGFGGRVPPAEQKKQIPQKKHSRYIPSGVKNEVMLRDKGRCQYKSPQGKPCGARAFLQWDHLKPFALGGASTTDNLQLLCASHNRYRAAQTFGLFERWDG